MQNLTLKTEINSLQFRHEKIQQELIGKKKECALKIKEINELNTKIENNQSSESTDTNDIDFNIHSLDLKCLSDNFTDFKKYVTSKVEKINTILNKNIQPLKNRSIECLTNFNNIVIHLHYITKINPLKNGLYWIQVQMPNI